MLHEYQTVLKRETTPRAVVGMNFLHKKVAIDIAGCIEWHEYKSLHKNVGMTDVEDNDIFADSSIVQFDCKDSDGSTVELIGVFTWNSDELRYEIDIAEKCDPYVCLSYNPEIMSNFKIIDILQNNKKLMRK